MSFNNLKRVRGLVLIDDIRDIIKPVSRAPLGKQELISKSSSNYGVDDLTFGEFPYFSE